MVRRSALIAVGAFDELLPSVQDLDLWLRLCEQYDAVAIPEALVTVAKGNDRGRISANVGRTVWGRELFCEKHRNKMIRYGVLYVFLRESGWWQQRRVGDPEAARRFYAQSISANPFAVFTYLLLLATYLPISWMNHMARCKHSLDRYLRFARDNSLHRVSDRIESSAPVQGNSPNSSAAS
jgi:hypothetical protein